MVKKNVNAIWESERYHAKLEFITPLLGSQMSSQKAWSDWKRGTAETALKKQKNADGQKLSEEEIEKILQQTFDSLPEDQHPLQEGKTVFARNTTHLLLSNHEIKGYLKSTADLIKQFGTLKALKNRVQQYLYIEPRQIPLVPLDFEVEEYVRPLRRNYKGVEMTTLANSEMLPLPLSIEFEILSERGIFEGDFIEALLAHGDRQGIGQFRNGGFGQFIVKEFELV